MQHAINRRDIRVQEHFSIQPDLYYSVPQKIRDLLNIWIEENRHCTSCGETYKEIDNIGTWRCRQHVYEADTVSEFSI